MKKLRPDLPIIVMSAQNTFMTAIKASERGAYDYLPKPFDLHELVSIVGRAMSEPKNRVKVERNEELEGMPLVGRSPAMQEIYRSLARLMQTDLTVMITGESGTGKELVARALHDYGKRKKGPFVAINMAAIPRDLIESELFGHEKGAFTGANQRSAGRFEQAEGGTLFLDEIGDMPMEAQTRLLRVLQQGEYTTVGGRTPIKTNVRIIAATNKDLLVLIQQGLFREDLFFRLNVVPLRLPPLRERIEDIGDLVQHFFAIAANEGLPLKHIEPAALERMKRYRWPGNIRELENLMRRLAALYPQDAVTAHLIDVELAISSPPLTQGFAHAGAGGRPQDSERPATLAGADRAPSLRTVSQPWRQPAAARPLSPHSARTRISPDLGGAGGDARQPDQGRRAFGAQSQHAAQEGPRPRHPADALAELEHPPALCEQFRFFSPRALERRAGHGFLALAPRIRSRKCRNHATPWHKSNGDSRISAPLSIFAPQQ